MTRRKGRLLSEDGVAVCSEVTVSGRSGFEAGWPLGKAVKLGSWQMGSRKRKRSNGSATLGR